MIKEYLCLHCGRYIGGFLPHKCRGTFRKRNLSFKHIPNDKGEQMKKLYDVIIDRSSTVITVSGEDENEASENALEIFKKNHKDNFDYWVGDVDKQ